MKKILIIEDDELLGDLLVQKLQGAGYECQFVRDGSIGFAKISEWLPDLVILDLFLPILNGFDILSQKKLNSKIAGIPAVVLTNSLKPTNAGGFDKLGVSDFIIKSDVTQEEILNRIKKVLEKNESSAVNNESSNIIIGSKVDALLGKTILIVEDDKFLGSILVSRFSDRKCKMIHVLTGESALLEITKKKPNAILLDILLPGIDGFTVLEKVRNDPVAKDVPVIIISNFNQMKDKEKAESLGAKFLVKALANPDEIVSQVEDSVGGK